MKNITSTNQPNLPIRKATLRAREDFVSVEEKYEKYLKKIFGEENIFRAIDLLDSKEIEELQKTGVLPQSALQKLIQSEETRNILFQSTTAKEEKEITKALFELAKVCIDWTQTKETPEILYDLTIDEILEIILKFRGAIKHR